MLAAHYAPRTQGAGCNADRRLRLARRCWHSAPDDVPGVDSRRAIGHEFIRVRGDLDEAAANLFGYLRALDARGARGIAVMPVPRITGSARPSTTGCAAPQWDGNEMNASSDLILRSGSAAFRRTARTRAKARSSG